VNHQPKLVLVGYIDPVLKATRGTVAYAGRVISGEWIDEQKALLGVKKGKWRILENIPPLQIETRVALPAPAQAPGDKAGEAMQEGTLKPSSKVAKKRVAWVQDQLSHGGAEISGNYVARIGADLGFEVRTITRDMPAQVIGQEMLRSDLAVLNNLWAFTSGQMRAILHAIYAEGLPYVKYEHDHRELYRREFSTPLFQRSRLNVFLSPAHLENHRTALGCDGVALPLAIDVEMFRPLPGVQRKPGTALVCNVRNFKTWNGLQAYIAEHGEMSFTVLSSDPPVRGGNVIARSMVSHEAMPALYSEYEYLVHILDGWGAGERVIFEAALCGCKIVANERVGHTSWGRDLEDTESLREWLAQAPYDFWREVDRIV
jgi:hypothetical protein